MNLCQLSPAGYAWVAYDALLITLVIQAFR
jgi:hypothetical protein